MFLRAQRYIVHEMGVRLTVGDMVCLTAKFDGGSGERLGRVGLKIEQASDLSSLGKQI